MKKLISLLLSTILLSSTVACSKTQSKTDQASTSTNRTTAVSDTTSSKAKNPQAAVPAGTSFDTTLAQDISTGKNQNNDRFTLQLKDSSLGKNQAFKNAQIQGHLEDIVKATKGKKASLHLVFDEIVLKDGSAYPIDATLVNTQTQTKTQGKFIQNAGIILGGAAAGHFLGNKTKFKHGGLAGGAAAAAFVLSSPGGEVVLKKGTDIKLKLKTALNTTP
jgi:hypothetical protein